MKLDRCAECARRELSIAHHRQELKRLAYLAQNAKAEARKTRIVEDITKTKRGLAVARDYQAEHLAVCDAVDRIGVVA